MVYGGDPANSTIDQVRLLIGDTSTSASYLSDNEVNWYISAAPNVYMAGALACEGLVAQFNSSTSNDNISSKKVGDLSINYAASSLGSGQIKTWSDLAETLRAQGTRRGGKPYTGGVSRADKNIDEVDADKVHPDFTVDMMSTPGTRTSSYDRVN